MRGLLGVSLFPLLTRVEYSICNAEGMQGVDTQRFTALPGKIAGRIRQVEGWRKCRKSAKKADFPPFRLDPALQMHTANPGEVVGKKVRGSAEFRLTREGGGHRMGEEMILLAQNGTATEGLGLWWWRVC